MAGHSAAASAAGYLYQTNWALVDLLRKGQGRPDQAITLEMHDDVAWTSLDDPTDAVELLQVKLHPVGTGAGLGDMAVDMWKTLKVRVDRPDAADPQGPELSMVTTSVASPGTACARRPAAAACGTSRWLAGCSSWPPRSPRTRPRRRRVRPSSPSTRRCAAVY